MASSGGHDVGALVLDPEDGTLWLRRVGVIPDVREHGVATALVAEALAGAEGYDDVAVLAREELPGTAKFWREHGFVETAAHAVRRAARAGPDGVRRSRRRGDAVASAPSLARVLRAGDVVVLSGGLGAGKTTFTQGLGAGLGVRGDVTSPTFVIARVHPSLTDGPALVHVDAYRIGGVAELDDLDLDTSLDEAVTVVEWGEGLAEGLADDRVEVRIERAVADEAARRASSTLAGCGSRRSGRRWLGVRLSALIRLSRPSASARSSTSAGSSSWTRSHAAASSTGRLSTSTTASPSGGLVGGPVTSTRAVAKAHALSGCGKWGWCGRGVPRADGLVREHRYPAEQRRSPPPPGARGRPGRRGTRRPRACPRAGTATPRTDRQTTTRSSGVRATRCSLVTSASSGGPSRKARSALA